jgi:hypothetical protein
MAVNNKGASTIPAYGSGHDDDTTKHTVATTKLCCGDDVPFLTTQRIRWVVIQRGREKD